MNRRTALLLVDVQRDFLEAPGLFPPRLLLLERWNALIAGCRGQGISVFHARTVVRADGSNRMPHWQRNNDNRCVEGTAGALPPEGLETSADEAVYEKTFYSAFSNSRLDDDFRKSGIETLLIAGVHTQSCVQATVLDAYERGYQVTLVTDAVGSYAPHHADLTMRHLAGRACRCATVSELFPEISSGAGQSHRSQQISTWPSAFLNGEWTGAKNSKLWEMHDPCDWGRTTGFVPVANKQDATTAARRCSEALGRWSSANQGDRLRILDAWRANLERLRQNYVGLIVREVAKPKTEAEAEIDFALALLRETLKSAQVGVVEEITSGVRVAYRPRGVIAIITPWNNPLAIPVGKLAPALSYGNTVVWKPALQSPALVRLMMDSLTEAGLPANCVNVIFGDAQTARDLLDSPDLAAVSFTGSEEAGREIAVRCSLKGLSLQAELGGNNAALVAEDADIRKAAADLARAVFSFSGQRCTAPRRIIVLEKVFEVFCEEFTAAVKALKIGDPSDCDTHLGPLISKERQARMAQWLRAALKDGARLLAGGGVPEGLDKGCWFEPTVLADVPADSFLMQEETFGPLAVLTKARDFEHGLELCNGVRQGLRAICYTGLQSRINRFADAAQAGIIHLNQAVTCIHAEAPFLGWKASGIGLPEHGRWDKDFYTRTQTVYEDRWL